MKPKLSGGERSQDDPPPEKNRYQGQIQHFGSRAEDDK
jgi:hypothetical protein